MGDFSDLLVYKKSFELAMDISKPATLFLKMKHIH